MPSLKDLRNRISSVKATRKITKAMQMVAAAKLRRAQEAAQAARPYAERMDAVLAALNTAELLKSEQERGAREAADIVRRINAISASIRELIDLDSGDPADVSVQSSAP